MRRAVVSSLASLAVTGGAVFALSVPAQAAGATTASTSAGILTIDCVRNIQNTWGEITCESPDGQNVKEVRFDCSWSPDKVYKDFYFKGTWTKSHECVRPMTRIQVTI